MGASQHPSPDLRACYAIGNLAPGAALAVAAHLDFCDACRIAGDPAGRRDARERRRPLIEPPPRATRPDPATVISALPSLAGHRLGDWRRLRHGLRTAPLIGAAGLGEAVHVLSAAPTARVPSPAAVEIVLVLDGVLHDGPMTYQAGDFLERPAGISGRLQAGARIGCLCLVVGDDSLFRRGWLDRLLSWRKA